MAQALLKIGLTAGHIVHGRRQGGEVRHALFQPEHQGVVVLRCHPQGLHPRLPVVDGPGPLDGEQVVHRRGAGLRLQRPLNGKEEVLGRHRAAVAPLGVPPQVEGKLRVVVAGLPPLRHPGDHLALRVDAAQPLKQGANHQLGRRPRGRLGVQAVEIPRQQVGKLPVRLVPHAAPGGGQQQAEAQQQNQDPFQAQLPFLFQHKWQARITGRLKISIHRAGFPIIPSKKYNIFLPSHREERGEATYPRNAPPNYPYSACLPTGPAPPGQKRSPIPPGRGFRV